MNIYDYAMQMEKDGEAYYRELSSMVNNAGLKKIFVLLAEAEVVHYSVFSRMKKCEKVQMADTPILTDVKNIFVKMREEKEIAGVNTSQIALYKKAQEIEKKSRLFYLEKSEEVNDPSQKEIFIKIAEEEKKHFSILDNIIAFVSDSENWLENAEWYRIDY
ncbi:MAG: ferritin-like domain-containing protein [Candidatus Loosdrechtia sp.]|uniref:ferritin-like domain-containing protein n=1 Tax=Candidatus Loosdrechtia sp. TaxID=3101272 RepID=UPI003A656F0D|nr:MAG: ferritin family protein [Candidatus Jettenia sp. AMX2]